MDTHSLQIAINPRATLQHMRNRDPDEPHRVATALELLFDLVFVVGFSTVGAQFAHYVAEGGSHIVAGVLGFVFCIFALVWA